VICPVGGGWARTGRPTADRGGTGAGRNDDRVQDVVGASAQFHLRQTHPQPLPVADHQPGWHREGYPVFKISFLGFLTDQLAFYLVNPVLSLLILLRIFFVNT